MPDLLDLRLRTAKALGWVFDSEKYVIVNPHGRSRVETYRRGDQRAVLYYYPDGEVSVEVTLPDYPADLGACVEVLAAIEARGWEWELSCRIGDNGEKRYCMDIESLERGERYTSVETVSEAEADSRPVAICEAFCEAVEASKEP